MQMPGRYSNTEDYRYGFQGQETDDEVTGSESHVSYKYRMHDARLGRFLSLDPLAPDYAHNSPYAFSENVVIDHIELEGLEKVRHEADARHAYQLASQTYLTLYSGARLIGSNFYESYLAGTQPVYASRARVMGWDAGSTTRSLKFYGDDSNANEHGVLTNAYRHTLWSAYMAQAFGATTAKMFSDAHEAGEGDYDPGHMNISNDFSSNVNELKETGKTTLSGENVGDMIGDSFVDQLNNREGRLIAGRNPAASDQELQLLVLDAEEMVSYINTKKSPPLRVNLLMK
jgi:RHS repeat-associated protein